MGQTQPDASTGVPRAAGRGVAGAGWAVLAAPGVAGPQLRPVPVGTDRGRRVNARRVVSVAGTVAVTVIAAVASYDHTRELALRAGQSPLLAALLPLSVDGMIMVATLALGDGRERRGAAWLAFVVGVAASLAANVMVAAPDPVARVVSAWPAVALLLTVEVLARGGRSTSPATGAAGMAGAGPVAVPPPATPRPPVATGGPATVPPGHATATPDPRPATGQPASGHGQPGADTAATSGGTSGGAATDRPAPATVPPASRPLAATAPPAPATVPPAPVADTPGVATVPPGHDGGNATGRRVAGGHRPAGNVATVAAMLADRPDVTGTDVAAALDVPGRTARRYLAAARAMVATG
jgi:hypothetical protein